MIRVFRWCWSLEAATRTFAEVRPCCGFERTAGNRGRPWEACGAGPRERDGERRRKAAGEGRARGGATQRACGLAGRHALLFRSRRRAAGNPRLAILTPHAAFAHFSPSTFFECAPVTAGTWYARPQLFFSLSLEFVTAECRARSRPFPANSSS